MNKLFYRVLAIIQPCISVLANAQSDSSSAKFNFKMGVYYNSNLNYYGRTDSMSSSGIFPLAELWFSNKFYINAAPVFTTNSITGFQYAGAVATAGYLKNNGKSATHIYFVKPIYKDNSHLVQSALKGQLVASFTSFSKVMNITAGADVKFSSNSDYGANIGVDHIFKKEIPGSAVLIIDPSLNLYAGTRRFTQTKDKDNDFLFFPGTEAVSEDVKKFSILSYEFTVPVIFAKGKWMILATPAYVIPQNLVIVDGHPELSEQGKRMAYITVGAKISL